MLLEQHCGAVIDDHIWIFVTTKQHGIYDAL